MRIRMRILAVLGIVLLLLVGNAAPALAFNPQPEPPGKPLVNVLNAVVNDLAAIRSQLNSGSIRMRREPSPWQPAVNHLNAIATQLGVLYDRVDAVLAVAPPSDTDIGQALDNINSEAQGVIADAMSLRKVLPPECDASLDSLNQIVGGIVLLTLPVVSVNPASFNEGTGTQGGYIVLIFHLSRPSDQRVSVDYWATSGMAMEGLDFILSPLPLIGNTVVFEPGAVVAVAPPVVGLVPDSIAEADETFYVTLSGAVNCRISESQVQMTILNDDH